ncbi:MAG: energy transducer TonB [Bacteroidota bacterium]
MEQLNAIQLSFKCPKAFNELMPCAGGWYCNGCHKIVHDFRGKPEHEILDIFGKNGHKVCGMFEADRIRITTPLPKWRKWLAAAVLAMGFTGLHHTLLAQQLSKTDSLALTIEKPGQLTNDEMVFGTSEQSTEFPGGMDKFQKYITDNLKPDASCKAGHKAFVCFWVDKDGQVSHVQILRGNVSKQMQAQIIKIFENSPRWKPGMQNGRAVKQYYTFPLKFGDTIQ